ncbi:hypothetical protein EV356DRAFT_442731 [Viridothelium virens]|uniref:Uncharacterized protein n=1 Tax=Viridothelium virens TaxID=1048519 RepID=A0A6A6HFV2_VIRVR|nr:hypothetical protein EV356DRAFT_442731 [Viridothelium virens]
MARSANKRTSVPSTSTTVTSTTIPPPFSLAPSSLQPFLSTLDPSKVYITHIDTHPRRLKQQVFAVPTLLNLTIVVLLLWRTTHALPTYFSIVLAALGNPTPYSIDISATARATLLRLVFGRAVMFLLDWFLLRIILPWPVTFLLEAPENPVTWRWKCGFRAREIYIRVSRRWGVEELVGEGDGRRAAEDSPWWKTRVMPAIERGYVRGKTGYLMMDKSWDLDFGAMVRATKAVDAGEVEEERFEKSVWCYGGPQIGWLAWEVWRLDVEQGADQEEARKKIVAFKDRLTAMGKESLFFRWIEIVQYESSQQGGFTEQRQAEAVRQARELFQAQGVDFDDFVGEMGGKEGLPGMEQSS